MAGIYCDYHLKDYHGKYSFSWKIPVQSPNQAVRCCRSGCSKLGMVGLSSEEDAAYRSGERIFTCGRFIRLEVQ